MKIMIVLIKTMMPKLHSDNFEGIELIRPLYLVEEESIAVAEAAPDAPSLPELPVVKAKPAKPVNMRDSLKLDPKKGAVVQKK